MKRLLSILLVALLLIGSGAAITKTLPKWGPAQGFQAKEIQVDTLTAETITASTNVTNGVFADDITLDAGYDFSCNAGDSKFDMHLGTGMFNTTTGENYFFGNGTFDTGKTLTVPGGFIGPLTGAVTGDVTGNVTAAGTVSAEQLTSTDDALIYGTLTANDVISNTTVAGADLTASDDAIITDDLTVDGGARIDETLTVNAISCNSTIGGTAITGSTTVQGEQITSTDDVLVTDDLVVDGAARIDEASTIASLTVNTTLDTNGEATFENVSLTQNKRLTFNTAGTGYIVWLDSGNYMSIKGNPQMDDGFTWAGTASPASGGDLVAIGGASDIDYHLSSGTTQTGTGAVTINGDATVASSKALAVTTADKLTVASKIVPTEIPLATFNYQASSVDTGVFQAKGAWTLTAVRVIPRVAGTDGSAVTAMIKLCDDAEAPASGDNMLSGTFDLKGTADTIQAGTISAGSIADGKIVAVDFTGTLTSAEGLIVLYGTRA